MATGGTGPNASGLASAFQGDIFGIPKPIVIIGGGIALAVFLPKLIGNFTGNSSSSGQSNTTGATVNQLPSTIDPLTGVPYSVEETIDPATGLPAYYSQGAPDTNFSPKPPPPAQQGNPIPGPPTPTPQPPGPTGHPNPPPSPSPSPNPSPAPQYVHPSAWPAAQSTLSGIASAHGVSLSRLESLNPWILQQRGTWNLIYTSDNIRIA